MEKIESEDVQTHVSSSGVQWFAAVFILVLIGFFVAGTRMFETHRLDPGT